MGISYDSGPMIPFPDSKCYCGHKKAQHARLGREDCDNCNCSRFRTDLDETTVTEDLKGDMCVMPNEAATPSHDIDVSESAANERGAAESKPVIVGIEWHTFQGDGNLCAGKIGDGSNRICGRSRNHEVHSDEIKPDWIKESIPDSGLKDSGQRLQFASGMVRDIDDTKPAFDLVIPEGIPYDKLMLTRWAELLRKGAIKYARRNWEKADSLEELERAKASAFRHFMQWFTGEVDEDHAAAVFFNINEVETIRYKRTKETG